MAFGPVTTFQLSNILKWKSDKVIPHKVNTIKQNSLE